MGQGNEDAVRQPGVRGRKPFTILIRYQRNRQSSSVLSANGYKREGCLAFMGLTWDSEPVPHERGGPGFPGQCPCARFVLQKGKTRAVLARVVEKSFVEGRRGTLNEE